ncbi:MAG: tetratricopeptide repeat protein [Gammaproteobacteria bacterium]|nr:tetratricopeptide repeat protein [Gammaproteobacteria bacterium]
MSSLFAKLKQRNVFRVAAAYAVLSWILLQIADLLTPALHLPPSLITILAVILLLGLIPALIFSWVYELTPDGLKKESAISDDPAFKQQTGAKLNVAVIVMLAIAIGLLALDRLVLRTQTPILASKAGSTLGQSVLAQSDDGTINSIAVLPFSDFSAGGDQAHMGDGIADTILHMLSQVEGLRVAARTSSFSFRGDDVDVATIGQQLNVESVLEGSIQVAGDQLRIIAQLVRTSDQSHVWSKTFDRPASDIFAIQDEIANAVVQSFAVASVSSSPAMASARTDPEVYAKVLRARNLWPKRTRKDIDEAIAILNQAIDRDPAYAAARSELATALVFSTIYGISDMEMLRPKIREHVEIALQLDQNNATAYAARGHTWRSPQENERARADYLRALELNPSDVNVMSWLAGVNFELGFVEEAMALLQRAYETDPLNTFVRGQHAFTLAFSQNKPHEAIKVAEETIELGINPARAWNDLSALYMFGGRFGDSVRATFELVKLSPDSPQPYSRLWSVLTVSDSELADRWRQQAFELFPHLRQETDSYIDFEEYETALEVALQNVRDNDRSAGAYQDLIEAYEYLERYDDAVTAGMQALQLFQKPGESEDVNEFEAGVSFGIAFALKMLGRKDEAVPYVDAFQSFAAKMQSSQGLSSFNDLLSSLYDEDWGAMTSQLEAMQIGRPILMLFLTKHPYWQEAARQPGIRARMDDFQLVLDDAAEVIRNIDDPAFRNPSLLVADSIEK